MNSSMIGKIEKAHRYAKEPERVRIHSLESTFHGGHDDYQVALDDGNRQAFLGGEVMVNTRLLDADVVRKVGIAEGRVAFSAQQNFGASQKV